MTEVTGSFTGTGQSSSEAFWGDFTVSLSGFGSGTVQLERSFDDGSTWKVVETYTSDTERNGSEPRPQTKYRLNCTVYSSGTIVYRIAK